MNSALWSVITVTYNSAQALEDHWPVRIPPGVEWIVVDNASSDDSCSVARSRGARVERLESNVGFARACNRGVSLSKRPYLLFANPDLTVDFEDLGKLQAHLARYGGLAAPRLLNVDGSRQANARGYPFLLDKIASRGWRLPGSKVDAYLWPTPDETLWLMGAAVATTRSDLAQVGGWPERFFIYFEDHELGIIYREHGLPVSCLEELTWTHGWARAPVKGAGLGERLGGWKHELSSAIKFYAQHRGSRARPGRRWTVGNR